MPIPLFFSPSSSSDDGGSSSSAATRSPTTPVDDPIMHADPVLSSSPPASSKTHAFFSSSFAASPPPRPPAPLKKRNSDDSTASTSSDLSPGAARATSAPDHPSPTRSIFSPTSPGFHISRIFPSRYTSLSRDTDEAHDIEPVFSGSRQRRKPQFLSLDSHSQDETFSDSIESALGYGYNSFSSYGPNHLPRDSLLGLSDGPLPTPAFGYERDRSSAEGDAPLSPASSSASSSSSHISIRLPTPPPPPLLTPSKFDHSSIPNDHPEASAIAPNRLSDFTPRPSSYEPSLSSLLRPFDPAPISKAPSIASTLSTAATEDSHDHSHETIQEVGALHEGDIIAPMSAWSTPVAAPASPTSGPSVRLVGSLGTGAFSDVWLAEDLSNVPLELASKKSVRDLKRQVSLSSKGGVSRNSSIKSGHSRNGSAQGGSWNPISRNSSLRKLKARLKGMKPVGLAKDLLDEFGVVASRADSRMSPPSAAWVISQTDSKDGSTSSLDVNWGLGAGSSLSRNNSSKYKARSGSGSTARLVAVKLTPRRPDPYSPQSEERTRVGFVREVEVLRHISHPNITPLLSSWTTPTHHVLVLPYLRGGDLLSLVNDDHAWGNLSEGVVRRIWCEICRGVGWMHSVGLVHRDVKLENVLLTWEGIKRLQVEDRILDEDQPLCSSPPLAGLLSMPASPRPYTRVSVDDLPTPLIKLTDFGLSRFIDIGNGEKGQGELLTTRCGSEAYAAPELVMGSSSYAYSTPASTAALTPTVSPPSAVSAGPKHRSGYDARETDAWACGVVLYALVARKLPFGEGVGVDGVLGGGNTGRIGGERAAHHLYGQNLVAERRRWLMTIARGEWLWPETTPGVGDEVDGEELVGNRLVRSKGAKEIVEKLLVRDPRRRARIVDLWEDEWMKSDAIGGAMHEYILATHDETFGGEVEAGVERMNLGAEADDEEMEVLGVGEWEPLTGDDERVGVDQDDDEEGEDDGWLLDEEGIGSIARQEVV